MLRYQLILNHHLIFPHQQVILYHWTMLHHQLILYHHLIFPLHQAILYYQSIRHHLTILHNRLIFHQSKKTNCQNHWLISLLRSVKNMIKISWRRVSNCSIQSTYKKKNAWLWKELLGLKEIVTHGISSSMEG